MARTLHLLLAAILVVALLAVAWWYHSWGALALLLVGGAGWGWYRVQVARTAAAEKFFGDVGEETRMTGFQGGGSPSEMPVDRPHAPGRDEPHEPR